MDQCPKEELITSKHRTISFFDCHNDQKDAMKDLSHPLISRVI